MKDPNGEGMLRPKGEGIGSNSGSRGRGKR